VNQLEREEVSARWLAAAEALDLMVLKNPEDADLYRDLADGARKYGDTVLIDTSDRTRARPWSPQEKALLLAFERTNLSYLRLCEAIAGGQHPGDIPELIEETLQEVDAVEAAKLRLDGELAS
jgi:hypothetical protein